MHSVSSASLNEQCDEGSRGCLNDVAPKRLKWYVCRVARPRERVCAVAAIRAASSCPSAAELRRFCGLLLALEAYREDRAASLMLKSLLDKKASWL